MPKHAGIHHSELLNVALVVLEAHMDMNSTIMIFFKTVLLQSIKVDTIFIQRYLPLALEIGEKKNCQRLSMKKDTTNGPLLH